MTKPVLKPVLNESFIYAVTRMSPALAMKWLRRKKLLLKHYRCQCGHLVELPNCSFSLRKSNRQAHPRKRCKCRKSYSFSAGSIFSVLPGVDFRKVLLLLYKFAFKEGVTKTAYNVGVSARSINKLYTYIRDHYLAVYNHKYDRPFGGRRPIGTVLRNVVADKEAGFCRSLVVVDECTSCTHTRMHTHMCVYVYTCMHMNA